MNITTIIAVAAVVVTSVVVILNVAEVKQIQAVTTFEETWQNRVEVPLYRSHPACVLLDPVNCDKLQPIPNRQADNLDTKLTGYGFPWINLRSLLPQNCDVYSVEHFGQCVK